MGKWTPDYVDNTLQRKISALVSGAINRAAVEKDPSISYENFVRDLDPGDSFTTSLIDILVKELAERLTRPNVGDRRLIADRTAKSLRLLATPLRIYRERSSVRRHIGRRNQNYTHPPNVEMDLEEDEDEFDSMLETVASIEGARVNSALYDAFDTWPSSTTSRRLVASPSPPPIDDFLNSSLPSPTLSGRSGPWSIPLPAPTSNTSTLVRQPSIRRAARSRTVDFNDFTHRRRSSTRDSLSARSEAAEGVTEPRDATWSRSSQSARRFFPFSRIRRHESFNDFPWSEMAESNATGSGEESTSYTVIEQPTWVSYPTRIANTLPTGSETSDERVHIPAPRLRRGGIRAPESIISRHSSPVVIPAPVDRPEPPSPLSGTEDHVPPVGEPTAYPTPSSTENENVFE